jgi:RNA-directed DNA polymerase
MDFENYRIGFQRKAENNSYSSENIAICLEYARTLVEKNLPIIYNPSHFSGLVGYKFSYISRAIIFTKFFYRDFLIEKNNGKKRLISEPLPSLKEIQLWILKNILSKIEVSKFAKAYVPRVTLKQNLVFHRDQKKVLNLDVKDFFSNIRRSQVHMIFQNVGYSSTVSSLLSKLCCKNECLPQGAPTSPYLSNLIMRNFDHVIGDHCLKNSIRYTRYADDLTFSGDFEHNNILQLVTEKLKKLSLKLNLEKSKLMSQGVRQTVTGVVVNKKLQVSRPKRKKIRQIMYFIKKYGLKEHLERRNCNKENYLIHLRGLILFVLFINPEDTEFIGYKDYLNSLITP